MTLYFFDAFKLSLYDKTIKLDNLYQVFLLFDLDFQKVKKVVICNLTPTQRKRDKIDFGVFNQIIQHFSIKLGNYLNNSNNRDGQHNKIQTFYEVLTLWPRLKNFYLSRYGEQNSKSYDSDVTGAVTMITQLLKAKTLVSKNRIWLIYLYLEKKELSYIRLDY